MRKMIKSYYDPTEISFFEEENYLRPRNVRVMDDK